MSDLGSDAPRTGLAPYFQRTQPCGCRGVPDGQHLPGCEHSTTRPAAICGACGLRGVHLLNVCPHCGTPQEDAS
jgi:hypothetical protein